MNCDKRNFPRVLISLMEKINSLTSKKIPQIISLILTVNDFNLKRQQHQQNTPVTTTTIKHTQKPTPR